jgi:hypothetical protein
MRENFLLQITILFILSFNIEAYNQVVNGSFEDQFGNFSLIDWDNYGGVSSTDTPPFGGNYSLSLTGGCLWTGCSQEIPQIQNGDVWELTGWAKAKDIYSSGAVSWSTVSPSTYISDTVWVQFSRIDTFVLSPSDTVSIVIEGGGGFAGGEGILVDLISIEKLGDIITSIEDVDNRNSGGQILQNSPNPFTNSTIISFEIDFPALVNLKIFDLFGQQVGQFESRFYQSGPYQFEWKPSEGISHGIYLCEMIAIDQLDPLKISRMTTKIIKQK